MDTRPAQDQRITTALNLEQRRVAERFDELRRRTNTALTATVGRFAAAGHGPGSGTITVELLRLEVERLRESMRAAFEVRRELSKTIPEIGSPDSLATRGRQLHERIDAEWNAIPYTVSAHVGNQYEPKIRAVLNSSRFDTELILIKGETDRALASIGDEVALGMHKPPESRPSITVNISGVVGQLNLGTVIGDMNAAMTTLQTTGGEELAQALKRLAEAAAVDESLSAEERGVVIESLATITEEAARPPERRRWRVVQALMERIGPILAPAAQVAAIWNAVHGEIPRWFGH